MDLVKDPLDALTRTASRSGSGSAVSPNGQQLASADAIGNVLLWDISPWAKPNSDQPALAKPEPAVSDNVQDIETDEGIVISLKPNQPVTKLQREKALRQALKILMDQ